MKKIISVFLFALIMSFTVSAESHHDGWTSVNDKYTGELIGMSNIGEHGGKLLLLCDTKTHRLDMKYEGGGNHYDLFVFYNAQEPNMDMHGNNGKFIVGLNSTTQKDVYYNVLRAKKIFVIARFPVGSGSRYLKAAAIGNSSIPEIQQEGDEKFWTGSNMQDMMKQLNVKCPISQNRNQTIF